MRFVSKSFWEKTWEIKEYYNKQCRSPPRIFVMMRAGKSLKRENGNIKGENELLSLWQKRR